MNANELRIGNWIQLSSLTDGTECDIQCSLFHLNEINKTIKYQYTPIPLTEKWLLKFGFNGPKDEAGKYYELEKHRVYLFEKSFEFEFNSHDDCRFNLWKSYKYVHQLQNLYFALTNQELTINGN